MADRPTSSGTSSQVLYSLVIQHPDPKPLEPIVFTADRLLRPQVPIMLAFRILIERLGRTGVRGLLVGEVVGFVTGGSQRNGGRRKGQPSESAT